MIQIVLVSQFELLFIITKLQLVLAIRHKNYYFSTN